jgi:hypothetical protein
MKTTELNERLRKDRPIMAITVRMPEDVVEDLKRVAPAFGFYSDEALIRYYIGQGLRVDLERLSVKFPTGGNPRSEIPETTE